MQQILAMGGGGFWMEPDNPKLDRYILEASDVRNPAVCFLPTACGDSEPRINLFYEAFKQFECRPNHLSLFRDPANRKQLLESSDVIYVGGGNTRLMLAIWKVYGVDKLIRDTLERGSIICGLSAGAICWFESGVTDSDGPLGPMDCLGWLSGSCVPHYDGEAERRPVFHQLLKTNRIQSGLALDDGALAHFIDGKLQSVVTSRESARAYQIVCENGTVQETSLPSQFLKP